MKFMVNDLVHLLVSKTTDEGVDILYGNRGKVIAGYTSVFNGIETFEVEMNTGEVLLVGDNEIDIYNQPHLASSFTIERAD